jgi:DTW domain-containing protein YfiP
MTRNIDAAAVRRVCLRCRRPETVCYCAVLPTLETRTRVVILQHPRERDVAIGTARMASLCLPQASLHVGMRWDGNAALRAALSDPGRPPILLYPGPGAKDILREPPDGPVTLVVVDGTWSQAKTVVRDNPVLAALPRYAFTAPEPTEYRIRREPRMEYVSTIEALMHVLGALEGDADRFRALLTPFRAMVDAQLAHQAASPRARVRHPRVRPTVGARLPAAITERAADLVCVVAEANAWPYGSEHNQGDELVQIAARRLVSGETFDMIAAPERPLSPSTPFHTGLDAATLRDGHRRADVVAAFAGFLRPGDVLCSWGPYASRLISEAGGALPDERIDLRAAAQRLVSRKLGGIEGYAASVAPASTAPAIRERARRRLAMIVEMIEAWRAMAA